MLPKPPGLRITYRRDDFAVASVGLQNHAPVLSDRHVQLATHSLDPCFAWCHADPEFVECLFLFKVLREIVDERVILCLGG